MTLRTRDFFLIHMRLLIVIGIGVMFALLLTPRARADEDHSSAQAFWLSEFARQSPRAMPERFSARRGGARLQGEARLHPDGGYIHRLVTAAAMRHGVPVRIAHAVVQIESRYRCHVTSPMGARGIMQVLPPTARGVGVHGNLYDCNTGLEAGMRYLRRIIASHGTGCAAIGLYERGEAATPICTPYGRKAVHLASWS